MILQSNFTLRLCWCDVMHNLDFYSKMQFKIAFQVNFEDNA